AAKGDVASALRLCLARKGKRIMAGGANDGVRAQALAGFHQTAIAATQVDTRSTHAESQRDVVVDQQRALVLLAKGLQTLSPFQPLLGGRLLVPILNQAGASDERGFNGLIQLLAGQQVGIGDGIEPLWIPDGHGYTFSGFFQMRRGKFCPRPGRSPCRKLSYVYA